MNKEDLHVDSEAKKRLDDATQVNYIANQITVLRKNLDLKGEYHRILKAFLLFERIVPFWVLLYFDQPPAV
jgi:hypothetical protein